MIMQLAVILALEVLKQSNYFNTECARRIWQVNEYRMTTNELILLLPALRLRLTNVKNQIRSIPQTSLHYRVRIVKGVIGTTLPIIIITQIRTNADILESPSTRTTPQEAY